MARLKLAKKGRKGIVVPKILLIGIDMKVKASIKKRSPDDKIVRRRGKLYVINKKNPRNKQRQG